jgi:hypothetical protein
VSEYQAAFVEALRGGRAMQKRVFDTIEDRHAKDFRNGRVGPKLYEDLLSAVRESGMPAIEAEFEKRFLPLLKAKQPQDEAEALSPNQGGQGARWIWISTLCLAAITLGAVIVEFGALKTTFAGSPVSIKTPIVENDTPPSSPAVDEPMAQTATDSSSPAAKDEETTSEAATEPAATQAVEQEPAAR